MQFPKQSGEIIIGDRALEYTEMTDGDHPFLLEDLLGGVRIAASRLDVLRIAVQQAFDIPKDQRTDEAVVERLKTITGVSASIVSRMKGMRDSDGDDDDGGSDEATA